MCTTSSSVVGIVALLSIWMAVTDAFHFQSVSMRRRSSLSMRAEIAPRKVGWWLCSWVVISSTNIPNFTDIHFGTINRLSSLRSLKVDWMIDSKWMTFPGSLSFVNMQNQRFPLHRRRFWRYDNTLVANWIISMIKVCFYNVCFLIISTRLNKWFSMINLILLIYVHLQHDPCEEYIDGLTAQPWWDASQFEWVAGLEVKIYFNLFSILH